MSDEKTLDQSPVSPVVPVPENPKTTRRNFILGGLTAAVTALLSGHRSAPFIEARPLPPTTGAIPEGTVIDPENIHPHPEMCPPNKSGENNFIIGEIDYCAPVEVDLNDPTEKAFHEKFGKPTPDPMPKPETTKP